MPVKVIFSTPVDNAWYPAASSAAGATSPAAAPKSAPSFYMAALVALRHNPILRPLYLRHLATGKGKKLALTALMRKLIVLANHLLKNTNFALVS